MLPKHPCPLIFCPKLLLYKEFYICCFYECKLMLPPTPFTLSQHLASFPWQAFICLRVCWLLTTIPFQKMRSLSIRTFPFVYCSILIWLQFSSVTQSCPTICDPMDCSTPGFTLHHQLLELPQTHVHQLCDATQPSHPLSSLSPPAFNLSPNQGLF